MAAFVYYVRMLVTDLAGIQNESLSIQMESSKGFMAVSKHQEELAKINNMLDALSGNTSEIEALLVQNVMKFKQKQNLLTEFVDGIASLTLKADVMGNTYWGPKVKNRIEIKRKQERVFNGEKLIPIILAVKSIIYYEISDNKYHEDHYQAQIDRTTLRRNTLDKQYTKAYIDLTIDFYLGL